LPEKPPSDPNRQDLPEPHFTTARWLSALFGTMEVFILAILNPLAGLFLGVQSWTIKYTSQIMLEPLPALTSALTAFFYFRSRAKSYILLSLSSLFFGISVASKYPYGVIGLAVIADWMWSTWPQGFDAKKVWKWLFPISIWVLFSIITFIVFNPRMWSDPVGRLVGSIVFHANYATGAHVQSTGFPMWQQFVWLAMSVPFDPGVFRLSLDLYITILAIIGFKRTWQRQRFFALWLLIAIVFLFFWPTKWPQYLLILTLPLCLSASNGVQLLIWEPLQKWWIGRHKSGRSSTQAVYKVAARDETRRAIPWLLPGMLALLIIALFPMIFQAAMALTDYNAISIRDGFQGGIFRAVWQGLTGQAEPVVVDVFGNRGSRAKSVNYAGPQLFLSLLSGGAADVLVFNVIWMVLGVGLQALVGMVVALAVNRPGLRFRKFWRALFILPWAIPEFVGALVWLRLFEPRYGWFVLAQNVPKDVILGNWYEDVNSALFVMLIAATWYGFPFIMLAATAGLKMIPDDVYDAAAIDGASGLSLFRTVTWPLLMPLVIPAIIIRLIFTFNQFYLFWTLQPPWPIMTFATLSYFFFAPTGYFGGQFAVSAAINIFTVLILVILIIWFNRLSKAVEGVTYV
jgi:ABC-type sugar transport system permease subunit